MADKLSLTAFIVARSQIIASRIPRWTILITEDALELSYACVRAARDTFFLFRLLGGISDHISAWLLDRLVVPGFVQHIVARKQHVNAAAHAAIHRGAKQIVMVGAGYDALALRIAREYPDMLCLEIDLPSVQATKRAALHSLSSAVPRNLHFAGCDFSTMSLKEALSQDPLFEWGAPTVFVAEALSMYLSESENRALLKEANEAAGGKAEIIFTAMESMSIGESSTAESIRNIILSARREPFRWSVTREGMERFALECGFTVIEALNYAEIQRPYITDKEFAQFKNYRSENFYVLAAKKPLQ